MKHVWFDTESKRWMSAPFTYLPDYRHKPHGRRRMTWGGVYATPGGVR